MSSTKPQRQRGLRACQPILRMDSGGDIYATNGELIVARILSRQSGVNPRRIPGDKAGTTGGALPQRSASRFNSEKNAGKDTPAQFASRITVFPSAAKPATANAMAMR